MAIYIRECVLRDYSSKSSGVRLIVYVPQTDSGELKPAMDWLPGLEGQQLFLTADWHVGDGQQVLGYVAYNGLKHVTTGGSGGFNVSFRSVLRALDKDNVYDWQNTCIGEGEDNERTFELVMYLPEEAADVLKKRKRGNREQEEDNAETV